jgi:hypothetical protein
MCDIRQNIGEAGCWDVNRINQAKRNIQGNLAISYKELMKQVVINRLNTESTLPGTL